jgi:hypothetical protein
LFSSGRKSCKNNALRMPRFLRGANTYRYKSLAFSDFFLTKSEIRAMCSY